MSGSDDAQHPAVNTHCDVFLVRYADSVGAKHFHTSAKTNKGLEDVFNDLSKSMRL